MVDWASQAAEDKFMVDDAVAKALKPFIVMILFWLTGWGIICASIITFNYLAPETMNTIVMLKNRYHEVMK